MLDTIKKFASIVVGALTTLAAGGGGSVLLIFLTGISWITFVPLSASVVLIVIFILYRWRRTVKKFLMKEKVRSIVTVSGVTWLAGLAGLLLLLVVAQASWIIFAPPVASVVLIAIFIFYEWRRPEIHWVPALGKPDTKLVRDYFGEERENLKHANEEVYNAPIDEVVKFIDEEVSRYEDDLGYANLNYHFGRYQKLSGLLTRVKWQIENSRVSNDQRDELRRDIAESADFKDLLKYFDELRGSVYAIVKSIARKEAEARDLRVRWWIGISLTVIALVLVVLNFPSLS